MSFIKQRSSQRVYLTLTNLTAQCLVHEPNAEMMGLHCSDGMTSSQLLLHIQKKPVTMKNYHEGLLGTCKNGEV